MTSESPKVAEVLPKKGKMTVGLQKSTGDKVQYCITAL